jgi:predicted Zn-dependent protease with MMP-like domain
MDPLLDPLLDLHDDPRDPFEVALEAAIAGLPAPYGDQLATVAVVVEQEASPAQLASVGARGLLGLYHGVPRTAYGAEHAPVPSRLTLFRGPLMRRNPTPERLRAAVEETLIHELGHHLGISDERIDELHERRRLSGG